MQRKSNRKYCKNVRKRLNKILLSKKLNVPKLFKKIVFEIFATEIQKFFDWEKT